MDSSLDNFILSLDSGVPPPFATPTLRTVWHGLRGDWESAHDLAGGHDDPDFAWVHAWLHRIEGDPVNAEYWYQRAGRAPRQHRRPSCGEAVHSTQHLGPPR